MMEAFCYLEVDVNGEEIFMVDMNIVASYSGRLKKLFGRSKGSTRNLKVIFHDFPGGPESFELILKFCYGNGKSEMSPSNVGFLYSAAHFMEMNSSVSGTLNLIEQSDNFMEEINYWTWSDLLICLKRTQDIDTDSYSLIVIRKLINTLIGRMSLGAELSSCPSTASPESSGVRLSCDTKSTESLKTSFSRATWWFDDLLFLNPDSVRMFVDSLIVRKFDQILVAKFLIHYQKSKLFICRSDEKCKITEVVIDSLFSLEKASVSCKSLFELLRVVSSLNLNKSIRSKLETMIGLRLDQATLDNLLVPSPHRMNYLYDVNLVLRFVKAFTKGGNDRSSPLRLKRVGSLIDLYMAEVAPDPRLRPSKFISLAMALPDSARDSFDEMYRVIDTYLRVHSKLLEEEKIKICCALNYDKLSTEACLRLLKNPKFPSRSSIEALICQQSKLKSLLHSPKNAESFVSSPYTPTESSNEGSKGEKGNEQQVVVYAGKLDVPSDNEKLSLQGMQCRVMELEKVCMKLQAQMAKIMTSRGSNSNQGHARSLPWLCS